MKAKQPTPHFQTPAEQYNKVEKYKLAGQGYTGNLHADFRDMEADELEDASEQLAKSHGIYLEYNRATTGRQKDWMYMIRFTIPGGGAFTREQYRVFDELADKYTANPEGKPSLRLTTRQNIQFHWIKKPNVIPLVQQISRTGFYTLNGCGDNVRNVMGCPLSAFSDIYDANAMARKFGEYFRLPAEPHIQIFAIDPSYIRTPEEHFAYGANLLNRKFKIAFSAVHHDEASGKWVYDNCVELRTNDLGVAPIVENDRVVAFQAYIGGGQGEKNGKSTYAVMGKPLAIFTKDQLHTGLDAIVKVHQQFGDRENRHWARLKYVVQTQGIEWYQQQIRALGASFEQPRPDFDPGARMLHHGWHRQPSNGLLARGVYVENGRLIDGENGELKRMVRHVMETYDGVEMLVTPNQDVLFTNIEPAAKESFDADLKKFGHGQRHGKAYSRLRVLSGACVGLITCRLSYTESEQFEPVLIDQLDAMGYGDTSVSIGITGCERQCFRPATKTLGWVGQGPNLYALKLGGSEDARHQGQWLIDDDRWYLRQVPRDQVAQVCAVLIDYWKAGRASAEEEMGAFIRRMGLPAVIGYLKGHPVTGGLTEKTFDAPCQPQEAVCASQAV